MPGLQVLRNNLAKDHRLCNWVNIPMPGYPKYKNRIWKWDCRPDIMDRSATRKGWRLFAYVPDSKAPEPIPAKAFFILDKTEDRGGNYTKMIVESLRDFLAEESSLSMAAGAAEDRFRRQTQPDGNIRSLCLTCWESVAVTTDSAERDAAEAIHQCKPKE